MRRETGSASAVLADWLRTVASPGRVAAGQGTVTDGPAILCTSLARQIEDMERPKAAERQGRRTDLETSGSTEPKVTKEVRSADIAGDAVGMSRVTYQGPRDG